ncbi:DUF4856 domain-containing protein [Persicitalea jodogahamensis]|uniref:DUF4856 domain-containing protein n=1 Tax=Persicitalea jodogahamensis TaxID=402147 RepID=A0A8J3DA95_9BACT|nr:DUF4856 domain-containing protein [Persicitalea jodogahamensis]GHB73448.1 DUF4856 domain-containing protein [Persicitalea jodogahamensis]
MKNTPLLTLALAGLLFSCTDNTGIDPDAPEQYTVPSTYDFTNVEYKESASRISMWQGFQTYLGRGNSRVLSADTVNYLWNNTNSAFTAELASGIPYEAKDLNALSYNLSGKVADAVLFKTLADSTVYVSQFNQKPASKGTPGIIGSRLFNAKGVEYNQVVAKGLMGGLVLNNIISILDKIPSDNNTTVVAGQGTAMEHNWDLAFGYVGIPIDYDTAYNYRSQPIKADRPLAIGGYFGERGVYIQAGGRIFEAFRKGRAAISARDYAARDEAIATIKEYLEKTLAAAAYYYVTAPQSQAALDSKFHGLSEGAGFVAALKYRPANSKLTAANYQTLVSILNTSFYTLAEDASNTKLKQAQAILTDAYGKLQP